MNSLKKILFGLTLTALIITSCTPPGTTAAPGPDPGVSIKNITSGDESITVTLLAAQGIKVSVFAHEKEDYSDTGIKKEVTATGVSQEVIITGLTNNTAYYIRIQGSNEKETSPWSEPEEKAPSRRSAGRALRLSAAPINPPPPGYPQ